VNAGAAASACAKYLEKKHRLKTRVQTGGKAGRNYALSGPNERGRHALAGLFPRAVNPPMQWVGASFMAFNKHPTGVDFKCNLETASQPGNAVGKALTRSFKVFHFMPQNSRYSYHH
jgi:hypothetical protein